MTTRIAIVGLGYVGLPLSLQFARSGVTVIGLDVDPFKVSQLRNGLSYIKHIEHSAIAEQVDAGRLRATTDFSVILLGPSDAALSPGHQNGSAGIVLPGCRGH